MIYSLEEYYGSVALQWRGRSLLERLARDRITMAVMIASSSPRKDGVDLAQFTSVAEAAEEHGCLAVYVDVYGTPLSYVLWGYCDRTESNDVPQVWLGDDSGSDDLYLIDFVAGSGCVDETVSAWTGRRRGTRVTVRRGDRPKKLRTYSLRRIRRRVWLSSRVYERFASPKEHGFCEHESGSLEMVEHFEKVRLVLAAVTDEKHEFLEITKAVPLVADLLSVDQVLTTFEQDACKAVLLVALSNAINWTGDRGADVFTLPFRRFVDGPDVVIVSAHGDTARLAELLTRFLSTMRELGETQVYLTNTVSTVVGDAGKRCIAYEGWRVVPSDSRGLIRCVRS